MAENIENRVYELLLNEIMTVSDLAQQIGAEKNEIKKCLKSLMASNYIVKAGIVSKNGKFIQQYQANPVKRARFSDWKPPEIKEMVATKWHWLVQHAKNLKLGKRTDIGSFTYINARKIVEIQDDVQIGSHCSIYSSTSIDNKEGKVILKRNCKIGSHCTIMPLVTIGENSIIGAHSFVNKDIPKNVVAFGRPAKVKRKLRISEINYG